MRLDGTDQKQLTADGQNLNPTMTADGRYIVFVSNRGGAFQIWRMNADGSNQIQLTNSTGADNPAVSPDGRWIVYHAVEDWSLWKVPIEGGTPVPLTKGYCVSPSLSADGKLIACVGKNEKKDRRLVILPSEGGSPLRVFDPAPLKLASHRLQWDGDSILFAGSHDGVTSLYKQSVDGRRPEKLFDFSEDDVFDFSYSPKRNHLAAIRSAWRFDIVLLSDLLL
jgi:TolB protein